MLNVVTGHELRSHHGVVCSRWAFALGVHGVLSLPRSALSIWGSSDQSSQLTRLVTLGVLSQRQLAIFVALTGMLLVSSSLPVRKPGLWLVVPLSPLLLLVIGCLIVLLPCACGLY